MRLVVRFHVRPPAYLLGSGHLAITFIPIIGSRHNNLAPSSPFLRILADSSLIPFLPFLFSSTAHSRITGCLLTLPASQAISIPAIASTSAGTLYKFLGGDQSFSKSR